MHGEDMWVINCNWGDNVALSEMSLVCVTFFKSNVVKLGVSVITLNCGVLGMLRLSLLGSLSPQLFIYLSISVCMSLAVRRKIYHRNFVCKQTT